MKESKNVKLIAKELKFELNIYIESWLADKATSTIQVLILASFTVAVLLVFHVSIKESVYKERRRKINVVADRKILLFQTLDRANIYKNTMRHGIL